MAEVRSAVGLMSGTSLDGVDVALIDTDGERILGFGPARTFPYGGADRALFRQAFNDARGLRNRTARPGALAAAEALVTLRHTEAVEAFLADESIAPGDVDLVGFHGQTVFHDPSKALTVQIGDGQALADRLTIPVVWDFRAADMAANGQGAPLAPVFHRALAEKAGLRPPVLFLNLGGVANVTYVGAGGELIAFDTGPGNGLLDDWIFERAGKPFDADGSLAAKGTPAVSIVSDLLAHPYFELPPPKSLDRNAFSITPLACLTVEDGAATLLQFSAQSVAAALQHLPEIPRACFVSGGGRRNIAFMRALGDSLKGMKTEPLEALGFDGDATEAQAFGFLGVRSLKGLPLSYPLTTGVQEPLSGGVLSLPKAIG
jgi:anhydro-N-acetylmuramic acid kinase